MFLWIEIARALAHAHTSISPSSAFLAASLFLDTVGARLNVFRDHCGFCPEKWPLSCASALRYRVSEKYPEISGVLAGLSFGPIERPPDCGIEFESPDGGCGRHHHH